MNFILKKKLQAVLLASSLFTGLNAQETSTTTVPETPQVLPEPVVSATAERLPRLNAYMKLDYVNSTLTFNESMQSPSSKSNVLLGFGFDYKFNSYVSLYGELAMAGLGAENITNTKINSKTDLHFTTILIPVGAKFYPIPQLALTAGFNLGFITNALGTENGKRVKYEGFSSGNHAFSFGIEGHFSKKVFAEIRYNTGLSDISTSAEPLLKIQNSFLQVGLGYNIDVWYYNK